jgi:hypothetical protein
MDTQTVVYLVIGVVIVVGVGRLLAMSGRQYLASSVAGGNRARATASSAAMLVAVLFHLISLGLVAFISVLDVGSTAATTMMLRIGITLIVVGIIYGITLALLRSRQQDVLVAEAEAEQHQQFAPRDGGDPMGLRTGPNPEVRLPRETAPEARPTATGPGGETTSPDGEHSAPVAGRAGEGRY